MRVQGGTENSGESCGVLRCVVYWVRSKREQLADLHLKNGSSQGQNLALTVSYVPSSLDMCAEFTQYGGYREVRAEERRLTLRGVLGPIEEGTTWTFFEVVRLKNGSSQGHNMALTVLYVP